MIASSPVTSVSPVQRTLGFAAAVLMVIGLATGLYAGLAMSGKIPADGHAALASHLNALMGTFLLVSLGWTLPMLRYGEVGQRRLAWVFIVSSYANWIITAVKAALFVSGLDLVGKASNDGVFIALQAFVVLPTLAASVAWALGFRATAKG